LLITICQRLQQQQETRLAEFDQIDQYNYGLSTNEQLCYQQENANDVVCSRFLVDEAEKFFNDRLNELSSVVTRFNIEGFYIILYR
jgi:hypothetical protein